MISKKLEDALLEQLSETNAQLEKCRQYLKRARGDKTKRKLERLETWHEAQRLRLSICMDILNGRAFTVYEETSVEDVEGEAPTITVVKPSPSQARLIDLTEKLGGKVTSHEFVETKDIEG